MSFPLEDKFNTYVRLLFASLNYNQLQSWYNTYFPEINGTGSNAQTVFANFIVSVLSPLCTQIAASGVESAALTALQQVLVYYQDLAAATPVTNAQWCAAEAACIAGAELATNDDTLSTAPFNYSDYCGTFGTYACKCALLFESAWFPLYGSANVADQNLP